MTPDNSTKPAFHALALQLRLPHYLIWFLLFLASANVQATWQIEGLDMFSGSTYTIEDTKGNTVLDLNFMNNWALGLAVYPPFSPTCFPAGQPESIIVSGIHDSHMETSFLQVVNVITGSANISHNEHYLVMLMGMLAYAHHSTQGLVSALSLVDTMNAFQFGEALFALSPPFVASYTLTALDQQHQTFNVRFYKKGSKLHVQITIGAKVIDWIMILPDGKARELKPPPEEEENEEQSSEDKGDDGGGGRAASKGRVSGFCRWLCCGHSADSEDDSQTKLLGDQRGTRYMQKNSTPVGALISAAVLVTGSTMYFTSH